LTADIFFQHETKIRESIYRISKVILKQCRWNSKLEVQGSHYPAETSATCFILALGRGVSQASARAKGGRSKHQQPEVFDASENDEPSPNEKLGATRECPWMSQSV
jgi:hypothetical protein